LEAFAKILYCYIDVGLIHQYSFAIYVSRFA